MSFGFRKSFSSGPFRATFSKRGLSTSFGAGGARITSGPRGTYVTFCKSGFYYRQRIDQPAKNTSVRETTPAQTDPVAPTNLPNAAVQPETKVPSPEVFGDIAPDDLGAAEVADVFAEDVSDAEVFLAVVESEANGLHERGHIRPLGERPA